ncbi:type 1 glutamine amidotransferase domain-containing protein [Solimonas terrae]|uniref:ThiJ/pfpI-family protein n=1 Tax=Solimonas terrae TaxID=1396819 RepID=A0A6M2BU55_9GAMM|nr:type 1 glutamine amidotransferase domain-containing protein [Solimonas terrae]NGY05643.1 thiJ/pfpI-family protein [Solimonas terrae]
MNILLPLPRRDYDPSEVAVSWRALRAAGHAVRFATPDGAPASADPLMLSGEGLDAWGFVPGLRKLRLIGLALRANGDARAAHDALLQDAAFRAPLRYESVDPAAFDALLLPGGHAKGMRDYLESELLQAHIAGFFDAGKPVAAICHGVVLAARSVSRRNGRSVLHGRKTTALTWKLEKSAWDLTRYWARFWDSGYYRTYAEQPGESSGYRGVQQEVTRALACPADFLDVPADDAEHWRKASGLFRDSEQDARPAFVVRDGHYVSARWPGDVHAFARAFVQVLGELQP